jgi:1-deoxy-D-xylulose-5-phosphate synthase
MTRPEPTGEALLAALSGPADLRRLEPGQLPAVATALRSFLVRSVARSGGHLAAGLGAVELAIALHYLYETPSDALVWDIGHQAYPHKVLTGRRERMGSIRKRGGLSGFLRREESPYDAFGAGHSSTSISAALGMALATAHQGRAERTVAVIGDGALSAGMAWEALNHAGASGADLLVVLNDNGMSISPNVGALCSTFAGKSPGSAAELFAALGFAYSGPVDGHDLPALLAALGAQRAQRGPRLLHVMTEKGHGYAPAEADPVAYHGVSPFDPERGLKPAAPAGATTSYSQVFGDWLCEAAEADPDLVAITPAMREGSSMVEFAARFPARYHDVGIAEQHAVTLAGGLACRGLRPVLAIYSSFLQRGYDQLIHDLCIQKLPVLLALDRAGVVGPDGATHNGSFDLSFLRCLPNMVVMAPSDGVELRNMLHTARQLDGPVAVRYPRAQVSTLGLERAPESLPVGQAAVRRAGRDVAILSFGGLLGEALRAAERLDATVCDMRFVKPLDGATVLRLARSHSLLVSVEDNAVCGGAGSAVAEFLNARGVATPLLQLGLPDSFPEHGSREEVLRDARLDAAGLEDSIGARLAQLAQLGDRRSPKRATAAVRAPERHQGGAPVGAGSGLSGVLMR